MGSSVAEKPSERLALATGRLKTTVGALRVGPRKEPDSSSGTLSCWWNDTPGMAMSVIPAPTARPPLEGAGRGRTAAMVIVRELLLPRGTESRTAEPPRGTEWLSEPRSVVMVIRLMEGCCGPPARGVTVMVERSIGWAKVIEIHCPTESWAASATQAVLALPSKAAAGPSWGAS